jgi:hypothetical protein
MRTATTGRTNPWKMPELDLDGTTVSCTTG